MAILKIRDEQGNVIDIPAIKGKDGKTPIKGVDYLNEADMQEIAQTVSDMIDVPTVPGWAKEPNKPTYTASEVGAADAEHNHDDAYDAKGSAEAAVGSANEYTDASMGVFEESMSSLLRNLMVMLYGEENWVRIEEGEVLSVPDLAAPVVADHNNDESAHSNIKEAVESLTERLNALANSDDITLDQLSEIVAYIKSNKGLIDSITTSKVSVSDVVDNLTTPSGFKPLSAYQGYLLKEMIDDITVPTKTSDLTNDSGFLTQHQDISGKADKSQGIFYIEGDSSSTTDTTNKVATWVGSHDEITEYFNGLTILYKVVTAGSTTTTLNINGLGAVTVVRNATTGISTACSVDGILLLTYTVDSSGTAYWKTADYDANTKNTAGTSNKTATKLYLVGGSSQSSSGVTTYTNSNIYIDTSNVLNSEKGFKGALVGNADTATKATQDASGNVIASTYETKADATAMYEQLSAEIDAKLGVIENGSY